MLPSRLGGWSLQTAQPVLYPGALEAPDLKVSYGEAQKAAFNGATLLGTAAGAL